jgi:hypothetical protein
MKKCQGVHWRPWRRRGWGISISAGCGDDDDSASNPIVFGGEANRLAAYDTVTLDKQIVIPSHGDDPINGLDINGQICFFPDENDRFIAGEDTNQPNPPQGWGVFQLSGSRVGELSATQVGKLTPTYQGAMDNAENYGCGFLSDGRLVTSDIGNQAAGPPNGQLIIWFPPFDRPSEEQRYCKLDIAIGTAGGIAVDGEDRVYVASTRGNEMLSGGQILRYDGPFPTSNDASGGCGQVDGTGAPLADAVTRDAFIVDPDHVPTASAIVETPTGTFYVSSVLNGAIAEYSNAGEFIRIILPPPPPVYPLTTGNPFGIGLAPDGTIYYADIALEVVPGNIGPGRNLGKVRRIRFEDGEPLEPEIIDEGLNFPDGIGVLP